MLKLIKVFTEVTLPQIYAWVAPWATPIPSALFLAYHVFSQAPNGFIGYPAFIGSFVGFEAAGGICATAVILLHSRRMYRADFWVSLVGLVFYVLAPWAVLNLSTNFAIPIYTALAAFAVFAANIWFQTGKEDKRVEEANKLELKKLRAASKLQRLQNATNELQKVYKCEYCSDEFTTAQAYGVHKGRYCSKRPL